MRRLNHPSATDERGATMVFIAVLMLGLLAMTAFAFDFGRIRSEQRELQTGADAGALAIAQDCVKDLCVGGYDEYAVAEALADANAGDGLAWVPNVALDTAGGAVTVLAATEDGPNDHQFDMTFAAAIGYDGLTVTADATVAWGPPAGLATLPLTFSRCEWESFGVPGFVENGPSHFLHHSAAVIDGEMPPTAGYPYADRNVVIYFHGSEDGRDCHASPSGQDLPGGFGWLDTNGNGCQADALIGAWVSVDTGSSPSNGCSSSYMNSLIGQVVFIPYFDDHRGNGSNAEYHIYGFGAYYLTGYYLGGQYKEKSLNTGSYACGGNERCIDGYFLGDWVVNDGEIGPGPDLGVSVIKFVS